MHRKKSGFSGRPLAVVLLLVLAIFMVGCGENLDPTDHEGAFNLFMKSFLAGEGEATWNRMAPSSHAYFDEQHQRLVLMDQTIERYLPSTDHKLAREQAGSILTDEIKDGKGLFMKVFTPDSVPTDDAFLVGLDVDRAEIAEDEMTAKIITRGGQTFLMTRVEGSEEWFVMLVRSSEGVKKRMKWLDTNESALDKTIEDLIEEEKEKREKLIAELMDVEAADKGETEKETE